MSSKSQRPLVEKKNCYKNACAKKSKYSLYGKQLSIKWNLENLEWVSCLKARFIGHFLAHFEPSHTLFTHSKTPIKWLDLHIALKKRVEIPKDVYLPPPLSKSWDWAQIREFTQNNNNRSPSFLWRPFFIILLVRCLVSKNKGLLPRRSLVYNTRTIF